MPAPYDLYDYVSYWEGRDYEDNSDRLALEYLLKKVDKRGSLIDIGGGFGRLCSTYSPLFKKCTVLDQSQKNLEEGQKIFKKITNVDFVLGSLPSLNYKDETFDVALLIRVSHHLIDPYPSFLEIARVLRTGGYFILEFANKNHFLAKVKSIMQVNFNFIKDLRPRERRSQASINERKITFVNHNPHKIKADLEKAGFEVKEILSVSNFRSPILKRIILLKYLLTLEKNTQKICSKFCFGPSLFVLAKKR